MARSKTVSVPFGRTTTEKRFVAAFGTVVIVLGMGAYVTLSGLEQLHSMMHESVSAAQSLSVAHQLERELSTLEGRAPDPTQRANIERLTRSLTKGVGDARSALPSGQALIAELARGQRVLLGRVGEPGGGDQRQRLESLRALAPMFAAYTGAVTGKLDSFEDHASAVAHSGFRDALVLLIGASVLTLVIGVALGRSVAKPLALLHTGARQIAGGDLRTRIDLAGPREFRELAAQLNDMVVATRENQDRLLESERLASVGRLAAGIAHEINNPLGVIRGYVKLARERRDDAALMADLQIIDDECLRCHEIVQGLMDLARPAVDRAAEVELRELADGLVDRLAGSNATRADRAAIIGDGVAWGNSRTIRQVLLNLFDNAFFATDPDGSVRVSISTEVDVVTVEVTDDGPGLPDGADDAVFEPFFTTKPSGTGLGLAVSRAIARAHGGDLVAHNAVDGGAVFRLTLPAPAEQSA